MSRLFDLRHSLKTRALVLALVNALLVLLLGLIIMGTNYSRNLLDFMRAPVGDRILSVSRKIALDLLENDSESWDQILKREAQGTPFQFALFDNEGKQIAGERMAIPQEVRAFCDNRNTALTYIPKYDASDDPGNSYQKGNFYLKGDDGTHMYWAGVHVLIHFMDDNMYGHGTLVWRFRTLWTNPYFFTVWPYATLLIGAVIITMLCWLPAVGLVLRRVSRLTAVTREIAKGSFDVPLPAAGRDEIGQLVESVAMMSRQLSGLLHQQQRFVSDAAHELTSPIARMQIATELLQEQSNGRWRQALGDRAAGAGGAPYVEDLVEDVQQMSELIQDLLLYSRTRNGKLPIEAEDCNLAALIREVLVREALQDKGVLVDAAEGLEVRIPVAHLRRALANLVRNAQLYAGEAGHVEVAASVESEGLRIFVRDQGPGIPEDELALVFAPFYRVEYARSRNTGGTGLGLAIVKSSVEACGGTVLCRNRKPRGLEVAITLPLACVAQAAVSADAILPATA